MRWCVCVALLLVISCLCGSVVSQGNVVLRRNGYTGVTIALSPRISQGSLPDDFAHTVAELVEVASKKVYRELVPGRAFFREVTLLVPSSLSASNIVDSNRSSDDVKITLSSRPSFSSSHFVIEPDKGALFGEHPYTLQYGSCGVQGLRTVLPFSSVVKIDGKAMAAEWLRLRYGVFSEEPLPNDPLYSPDANATKQGVLCETRSALRVILESGDFSGVNLEGESPYERAKLNIVQEAPLHLVVVWNVESSDLSTPTPYATTLIALRKFAQTLVPEHSMMALVAYSTSVFYADSRLIVMNTKEQRELFAKSYPTSRRDPSTLERAVVKALELLGANAQGWTGPQGSILLISHDDIRLEDLNAARKKLAGKQVRVHALLLSKSGAENNVEKLCSEYDGNVFLAQSYNKRALAYTQQTNAIAALAFSKTSYGETKAPIILKQKVIDPVKQGAETIEVFYVDSEGLMTLGVDIIFEQTDEASYYANYIVLHSPTDKVYNVGSPELTGQLFNVQQFKIQNASAGQWTLRIKPETSMPNPVKLEVWLQTSTIADPPITITAWLSSEFSNVDPSKPFLIYAEVRKGSNPIRYVSVTATVVDPEGNMTEFRLVDNGAGIPDITAGDGIYSRYFTGFSKKGLYTLSVTAEGSDQSVIVGGAVWNEASTSPPAQCCGSQFPEEGSVSSGSFVRHFEYGSFFSIADRPQGDIYPPSRVTDLTGSRVGDRVTLEWTAPGNDYDHGTANSYEIRYFESDVDFAQLFETSGKIIEKYDIDNLAYSPKPFGEREKCAFSFNHGADGGRYYFAIRANDNSNKGPVSNVVEVTFPAPTPPTVVPGEGGTPDAIVTGTENENDRNYARGGLTSLQLALAIVLPLLFLLILAIIVLLVVCFRRRGKRSKGSQEGSPPPPPTRARPIISSPIAQKGSATPEKEDKASPYATSLMNGSSISPINSYSADYLMDQYEYEKAKRAAQNGTQRTPSAPQRADLSSSSDAPSEDRSHRPEQVWTTPQGRDDRDDIGLPAVKPYVTELRPLQSPPHGPGSRRLPPDFSTVPRRQTFV
ncbi:calcium-activated chloride channel regulator 2-like [Dermacentor albipictus]|uniref:calcium-activated chloride channel regulator 2-like n=1 Tax=Dermacentor albipictus TaxID=60249 RepID=UPI0031FD089F